MPVPEATQLKRNCLAVAVPSGQKVVIREGARVDIAMTLTAPGCGMGNLLAADVWQRVMEVPSVEDVEVNLVFDPPWNASMMSEEAQLQTGMF